MVEFLANNVIARAAFLALLFTAVMVVVLLSSRAAGRRAALRADLRAIAGSGSTGGRMRLQDQKDSGWAKLAEKIEKAGLSLTDSKGDKLRAKLIAAGFTSPAAPKIFTLARLVLVIVLPAAYLLMASAGGEEISFIRLYLFGSVLALTGLYVPNLYVTAKADRRQEAIRNGFPDCLDLMLVCVEAGLGLEAAMDRVGREMVTSHPLVAELLSGATLQLRAGARREEALRKMGQSSGVDEIRSFATLLIQSDKLGTSIADTLRVYAAEMREKRRLRAEEKAHRLPVMISIPLVVCMLPTMIGVLMMPGVVRVVRQLMPALAGG
ncbi:type II secretion system F family protein [Altererythrobacter soli]|uniref:Type II secretion system F family protein n=1 Tax=Croceibacterium soli TaxID=1739690 RepID=A0A6I4UVS2_9SPHN|nr:type II secretion system F family protein [Croceibacterium soli]MXP41613.1 type II secretion system F family protein [Croceibacterium soli]